MARIPDIYTPTVNMQGGGQGQVEAPRVVPFQDPSGQMVAQVGAGFSNLGEGLSRVENQIDNARTKEAEGLLADFAVESLTKYRAMAGKSAVDGYQGLTESLAKRRKEAEKLLQNDTQRSMFRVAADRRMRSYQQAFQEHYLKQVKVWDGAQNEARMQQFLGEALLAQDAAFAPEGPDNPYYLAKGGVETAIRDQAALLQIPISDAKDSPYYQYRQGVLSKLHESVLQSMLDKNKTSSAGYYMQKALARGELQPEMAQKFKAKIEDRSQSDQAFQYFRQWRAEGKSAVQMAETLDGMLTEGSVTQEVYDKLTQRIDKAERDDYRKEQRDIRQTRDAVWEEARRLQAEGLDRPYPMTWDDISQDLREKAIRTGQEESLRNMVNSGSMYADTSSGLSDLRALRADPSPLIGQDWSTVENAFRLDMSNESLDELARIHVAVNQKHQVELQRQAELQAKELEEQEKKSAITRSQREQAINEALDRHFFPAMMAEDSAPARQLRALRDSEQQGLRERVVSAKTNEDVALIINRWESDRLKTTIPGTEVPLNVSPEVMRRGMDVGFFAPNQPFTFRASLDPSGAPEDRSLAEASADLQTTDSKGHLQTVYIEEPLGNATIPLGKAVADFNKQNPGQAIQTNVKPSYGYGLASAQEYLAAKTQLANELLADQAKRQKWEQSFGKGLFGASLDDWARQSPTLQNAWRLRERQRIAMQGQQQGQQPAPRQYFRTFLN